ncbi:MAG: DUF2027 domain-containing protein [Prevotella sp.]|nr:DUF2027 domain-containing protein [Prevotella sp.]
MKIGDKVRFLSETGGGVVAGYQGKNIVLVEDEDGFQIPTPVSEVVVVETDDYNIAKVHTGELKKKPNTQSSQNTPQKTEDDPADRPVTFRKPAVERKGGDALSAYIAFVPIDIKEMTKTRFETYFINDSNYYMSFTMMMAEGASWSLYEKGEVEPNTKLFLNEFGREDLNQLERFCVQILPYKRDKGFMLKPAVDIQFRIDPVKFYKLHTFADNDFFETPALIHTLIENDQQPKPLVIDAKKLKQQMYANPGATDTADVTERQGMVRRYEASQSKSKPMPRHQQTDVVVVDLHASELLETTAGMTPTDILNYQLGVFHKTLEQYKSKKGQKIVFIHGKGEGVLRQAIVRDLRYRYKSYPYQDASFQEYGYGATQVTIR